MKTDCSNTKCVWYVVIRAKYAKAMIQFVLPKQYYTWQSTFTFKNIFGTMAMKAWRDEKKEATRKINIAIMRADNGHQGVISRTQKGEVT